MDTEKTQTTKVDYHGNVGRRINFTHDEFKKGERHNGKIYGVLNDTEKGAYYQVKSDVNDREYLVAPSDAVLAPQEEEHSHEEAKGNG